MLVICWLIGWFLWLGARPLAEPDEGRYAEVAREMLANHDWVTPTLDGFHFFDKPIWLYWMTAAAFKVFGVSVWASRLWVAVAGLLALWVIYWAVSKLYDASTGCCAALISGSSLLFFAGAHVGTTDMGVASFVTIALCLFMVTQFTMLSARQAHFYNLCGWAMLGLAMLCKGLIALVLPGLIFASFMLWERRWLSVGKFSPRSGLLVFMAVAGPWFVLVCLRNHDFFQYFFVREHFQRFLTTHDHRQHQFWYFPLIVLAGLCPWIFFARAEPPSDAKPVSRSKQRFLLCWGLAIVAFFSISRSKLPFYVLPAIPAFAILIALGVARMSGRQFRQRLGLLLGSLMIAIAGLLLAHPQIHYQSQAIDLGPIFIRVACGLAVLAVAAVLAWRWAAQRRLLAVSVLSLSALLCWQCLFTYQGRLSQQISAQDLARQMAPHVSAQTEVFAVGTYFRGLPFYLGRYVTLVDIELDDISPGLSARPQGYLPTLAGFCQRWNHSGHAVAIVQAALLPQLQRQGISYQGLQSSTKGVLIWR